MRVYVALPLFLCFVIFVCILGLLLVCSLSCIPPNAFADGKRLFRVESKWKATFPPGENRRPPGDALSLAARTFTLHAARF